jgi:hypothetical protein
VKECKDLYQQIRKGVTARANTKQRNVKHREDSTGGGVEDKNGREGA